MKNIAVIFAGGVGDRMGSKIPKQFLEIYGKPIIVHTLEKFQYNDRIDEIYIGCKEGYVDLLKKYIQKYNLTKVRDGCVIVGGKTGLETIYKLLREVNCNHEQAIVLIHDGVRPNITDSVINKNIDSVLKYGNGITCVPAFETPIFSYNGNDIDKCLDREKIYVAKAPQSFKLTDILKAYEKVKCENEDFNVDGIVDSCSVALRSNMKLKLVEGNRDNIKVTTSNDYVDILSKMIAVDYDSFLKLGSKKEGNL